MFGIIRSIAFGNIFKTKKVSLGLKNGKILVVKNFQSCQGQDHPRLIPPELHQDIANLKRVKKAAKDQETLVAIEVIAEIEVPVEIVVGRKVAKNPLGNGLVSF